MIKIMLQLFIYKHLNITAMVHTENALDYLTVGTKEFAADIKSPEVYLIDVREPDEYATGHIDGATNIDVLSPDFVVNAEHILPDDKTIAVYCGTGKRSAMASEQLTEVGYKVINLDGGLNAWKEAGLPTVK